MLESPLDTWTIFFLFQIVPFHSKWSWSLKILAFFKIYFSTISSLRRFKKSGIVQVLRSDKKTLWNKFWFHPIQNGLKLLFRNVTLMHGKLTLHNSTTSKNNTSSNL